MADFNVGQTARASLYLPTAGQSFTRIASTIDGETVVWNPTFTDLGGGAYEASYVVNTTGIWVWYGTATDGTPWVIEWDVDPSSSSTSVSSTTGTTRLQLRRDILRGLGDFRLLTATDDGTDVDFRDTINLTGEPGIYRGREVLFVGGTVANVGQIRYVTGSSQSLSALGFGEALPAATVTGDVVEMINTRGTGFHFQEIHDAINQVIRNIGDRALVPVPFELDTYTLGDEIDIPDDFVTVENVQWQDEDDEDLWHAIRYAPRISAAGWYVDRGTRTVVVAGGVSRRMDGRAIRIWGLARPAELTADTDRTSIDPEYLVMQARANLAFERFARNPTPETERMNFLFEQRAGILRAKTVTRRSPFSVGL